MRRLVPLLLALPALAFVAPAAHATPPAAHAATPLIGIADQKDTMFSDARFQALGIQYARFSVAWDALRTPWQVAELDSWLALAQAQGVEPLITFAPSRLPGQRRNWPSVSAFVTQFKAFRARYPWVTTFATWNEANFCGFGPCHEPQRVAKWWVALQAACSACKVLAAEVLDQPSAPIWVKAFIKAAHKRPAYWGLHNYLSANRFQTARTKAFLKATRSGEVWFTETGGIVSRHNGSPVKLPEGTRHAAQVTSFVFKSLVPLSSRIKRVYLYQWSSVAGTSWDSGFVAPNGRGRPALDVLTKIVGHGKKPVAPPGQSTTPPGPPTTPPAQPTTPPDQPAPPADQSTPPAGQT